MTPNLTRLDKAALFTTGAGAAFKVLIWSLGASLTTDQATAPWLPIVKAGFALISFVAFDLVLGSVVLDARAHGLRWPGVLAVVGAAATSALIALEVAAVFAAPWLHAAPAVNLLLYSLHLMWPYPQSSTVPAAPAPLPAAPASEAAPAATEAAAPPQASATAQVNVALGIALPATIPDFIRSHATQNPQLSRAALAAQLGTSPDTVRRALEPATAATIVLETSDEVRDG
jgi:hypothetical protein